MESLVVRLNASGGPAFWQVVDAHGAPMALSGEGELEQAAALSEGRKVVLLLPAGAVFRSGLDLPARGRRAAAKGARYALEEQIAGDVEDLHFACGPISGDRLEVAAIERKQLAGWLRRCHEAGLKPDSACSEGDALPDIPNIVLALLEPDSLLMRSSAGQIMAATPSELAGLVDILCAEEAGEEAVPFRLLIYCGTSQEQAAREAMAKLPGREVELRLLQQGIMAQLSAEALSGRAVDLLQGEFRNRNQRGRRARKGALAALAALAVALLYSALLAIEGWRAEARYEAVASAVDARLSQLMPDVSSSAGLREELRRRADTVDLGVAARSDAFLRLIGELERVGGERLRMLELNFRNGSAGARIRAADMDTLEEGRRRLRSAGYSVVIQTATPESNGAVVAELEIRDERNR